MPGSASRRRGPRTRSTPLATRHQRRTRSSLTGGATVAPHADCTSETRVAALIRPSLPCPEHIAALEVVVAIDHRKRRMSERSLENQKVDPSTRARDANVCRNLCGCEHKYRAGLAQSLQHRRQSADVERCVCAGARIPPRREPEVRIACVLRATCPDVAKELPRKATVSSLSRGTMRILRLSPGGRARRHRRCHPRCRQHAR